MRYLNPCSVGGTGVGTFQITNWIMLPSAPTLLCSVIVSAFLLSIMPTSYGVVNLANTRLMSKSRRSDETLRRATAILLSRLGELLQVASGVTTVFSIIEHVCHLVVAVVMAVSWSCESAVTAERMTGTRGSDLPLVRRRFLLAFLAHKYALCRRSRPGPTLPERNASRG
ncbi:hypothetical protein At1D1108_44740 [Agrobacterium tumefaciens]|nr:hypothetical protein At1D1108_44740 [Agrobacterium tumefaciens]